MRSIVVLCVIGLAAASPAAAQSTYVSASLLGEFSRFGGTDVEGDFSRLSSLPVSSSRNGETIGFDVRIGRGLAERWGVEFAYARGGDHDERRSINPFAAIDLPSLPPLPGLPTLPVLPPPNIEVELTNEDQYSTFTTSAWVRQDLGRVALVFSGGVAFNRVESEQTIAITDTRLAIYAPFPQEIETVIYNVGPAVGAEAVFDVAEHAAITGGVRLHGVGGGWLIRPSVGLRWTF
jgi:hypothetical protein